MKKIIIAVALLLAIVIGTAYAATTTQKVSFSLDDPGVYSYDLVTLLPVGSVHAEFAGNLLTKGDRQELATLNGKLTVNGVSYSVNLKPGTLSNQFGYNFLPVELKFEGSGSNVRDGAGVLAWSGDIAYLSGLVVSKDQAYGLYLTGSPPTIQ